MAQKRATKFIISLKKYSYKDRLIQLNLPTLKYRRLRWDMIEVFKRVKQKYVTAIVPEFRVNSSSVTRESNYKILNQTFTTTYGIYTEDIPAYMRDPACKRARFYRYKWIRPPACVRGPASTRGPASIRSFTVYGYVYEMNTRQRTKGGTYINTTVQLNDIIYSS